MFQVKWCFSNARGVQSVHDFQSSFLNMFTRWEDLFHQIRRIFQRQFGTSLLQGWSSFIHWQIQWMTSVWWSCFVWQTNEHGMTCSMLPDRLARFHVAQAHVLKARRPHGFVLGVTKSRCRTRSRYFLLQSVSQKRGQIPPKDAFEDWSWLQLPSKSRRTTRIEFADVIGRHWVKKLPSQHCVLNRKRQCVSGNIRQRTLPCPPHPPPPRPTQWMIHKNQEAKHMRISANPSSWANISSWASKIGHDSTIQWWAEGAMYGALRSYVRSYVRS